ncbi:hypothetical protein EHYA_08790 [Embleya hyalina]|uniref:Uncharacterized protein n=1 Tax=Embleya hyalina TaxID=516124 RepID=A0A401Z2L3_9ACTN|nr:hypothetical protein EHYA_08790 [Embleya hyalina]
MIRQPAQARDVQRLRNVVQECDVRSAGPPGHRATGPPGHRAINVQPGCVTVTRRVSQCAMPHRMPGGFRVAAITADSDSNAAVRGRAGPGTGVRSTRRTGAGAGFVVAVHVGVVQPGLLVLPKGPVVLEFLGDPGDPHTAGTRPGPLPCRRARDRPVGDRVARIGQALRAQGARQGPSRQVRDEVVRSTSGPYSVPDSARLDAVSIGRVSRVIVVHRPRPHPGRGPGHSPWRRVRPPGPCTPPGDSRRSRPGSPGGWATRPSPGTVRRPRHTARARRPGTSRPCARPRTRDADVCHVFGP